MHIEIVISPSELLDVLAHIDGNVDFKPIGDNSCPVKKIVTDSIYGQVGSSR